jgi:hypothetical protein
MFQSIYISKVTLLNLLYNISVVILIANTKKFVSPFEVTKIIFLIEPVYYNVVYERIISRSFLASTSALNFIILQLRKKKYQK